MTVTRIVMLLLVCGFGVKLDAQPLYLNSETSNIPTPLGELGWITVSIAAQKQYYGAAVGFSLRGDSSFQLQETGILLSNGGTMANGQTHILFNPRSMGEHFAMLSLKVGKDSQVYLLSGNTDTVPRSGVFYQLCRDNVILNYPGSYYYEMNLLNHSYSTDSLHVRRLSLPKNLKLRSEDVSFSLAPGESRRVYVSLDTTRFGYVWDEEIVYWTNATNRDTLRVFQTGNVEAYPRLSTDGTPMLFTYYNQMIGLALINAGGRTLSIQLPELDTPFFWSDTTRFLELKTGALSHRYIMFRPTVSGVYDRTYLGISNSRNKIATFEIEMRASYEAASVAPLSAVSVEFIDHKTLVSHADRRIAFQIFDLRGVRVSEGEIDPEQSVRITLGRGAYFLRINVGNHQHLRRLVVE